jgi:hypothetical protein
MSTTKRKRDDDTQSANLPNKKYKHDSSSLTLETLHQELLIHTLAYIPLEQIGKCSKNIIY